jgi:hypothetical protein
MHAEFETLSLPELADRLEDLDGRRTPVGWTPEDAAERASVERCILGLIARNPDGDSSRLECELEITLRSKEFAGRAVVRSLGPGGVWIDTPDSWIRGTHVEMIVRSDDTEEHGLRVRGIVEQIERGRVRVSVASQPSEAHERRLRRFVLDVIRHRLHN